MTDRSSIAPDKSVTKPLKVYRFRPNHHDAQWKHLKLHGESTKHMFTPVQLRLVTWNLDFLADHAVERFNTALEYLQFDVFRCDDGQSPGPCCILLQEVRPECLKELLNTDWIRDHFAVTPVDQAKWPGPHYQYGNVTLVERTVPTIVLDLRMVSTRGYKRNLRVINTHLESMATGRPNRLHQLKECAVLLRASSTGGIVAGDLNAFDQDFDDVLSSLELSDAAAELDDEDAFTWGEQGGGEFPRSRMDRMLSYTPAAKMRFDITPPLRIGRGVRCGELWVSDHFGLEATLTAVR
ncbi:Endonuclease/exonuclease/phosphatase [Armillaria luteobubalina]|uniref:Endonuclease/exonuclease/phosphatase n=1 Tax=Armillaria luteobubalina TaxID=153913 RepID=A0AA39QCH9_9AGAR|nr:Endonuclease/exonuclease/phosphatase [Armillaria luteobubalina]